MSSFIEEIATNREVDAIPAALQVMQSVLTVLTRGGELLLNVDLFPQFEAFLHDSSVMADFCQDVVLHVSPLPLL